MAETTLSSLQDLKTATATPQPDAPVHLQKLDNQLAHSVLGGVAGAAGDESPLAVHEQPALLHRLPQRQRGLVRQLSRGSRAHLSYGLPEMPPRCHLSL